MEVTTVHGVESQENVFYMGTMVADSENNRFRNNWSNISDGFFKSPSIGANNVFQSNLDIVYVGTGSDG